MGPTPPQLRMRASAGRSFRQAAVTRPMALPLEEVRLVGFGRQRIGQAGQQLAHLTVLKVHTLQRIDDLLALEQHQVGVAAHQFGGQRVFHQIAHLVHALEVKEHNAVALSPPAHPAGGRPPDAARSSIQKLGGTAGFSKLSPVKQTRADPLRADSQPERLGAAAGNEQTSSRVGSKILSILESVRASFSS